MITPIIDEERYARVGAKALCNTDPNAPLGCELKASELSGRKARHLSDTGCDSQEAWDRGFGTNPAHLCG